MEQVDEFVERILAHPLTSEEAWLDVITSHPLKEVIAFFLDERKNTVAVCERLRELEGQSGISKEKEPSDIPSLISIRDRLQDGACTFTRAEVQRLLVELDRFHLCNFDCEDSETYHHLVSESGAVEFTRVWHRTDVILDQHANSEHI